MIGENENLLNQALADAGVEVKGLETQESVQEQEQQSSEDEAVATEQSVSNEVNQSSETQDASEQTGEAVAETTKTENPTNDDGEIANGSGIIDLSNDGDTEAPSETTTETANELPTNFNEMFGEGYDSIEDVKSDLEYLADLEARVEELEGGEPEFANEFVQKMNDYVKNGGDPSFFAKVNSIDVDGLSPKDALKLDLQWQHGITDSEAEALIREQYANDDWEEGDGVNTKEVQMKVEANKAKVRLKEQQADNTLITPNDGLLSQEQWEQSQQQQIEEFNQAEDARMWDETSGWASEVDKAVDGLKQNGVVLDLGNGKGYRFNYDGSDDYTKELIYKVDQALYDSGTSREENPELAKRLVEDIYFMENKGRILKSYGDEIRSLKQDEYHRLSHNPSALQRGDKPSNNSNVVTEKDVLDQIKNID